MRRIISVFGNEKVMAMRDCFNRTIDYMRISVTDRCNFRCAYCMPTEGVKLLEHSEILSYEELLRIIRVFAGNGIRKIRLTGGEPLVRKGIVEFIRDISRLGVIEDLSMTTNGSLLAPLAKQLKAAGLKRVNISLDTADPARFRKVTKGGNLEETLRGIEAAFSAGLWPVKLNTVLTEFLTESDLAFFVQQVTQFPVKVRFIEYMPIGDCQVAPGMKVDTVKRLLGAAGFGPLEPASDIEGNGPAKYFKLAGTQGTFGFITALSDHFCGACNRLRLTADGKLKPCLLSNHEIDLKAALRGGAPDQVLSELFFRAIKEKPERHRLNRSDDSSSFVRKMSQIGG